GWSPGDPVYYDVDSDDHLSVSDLRLVGVSSSLAPFSVGMGLVKSSDADITLASKDADTDDLTIHPQSTAYDCSTTFEVKGMDLGAQGQFDNRDSLYLLSTGGPTTTFIMQSMARLLSDTASNNGVM